MTTVILVVMCVVVGALELYAGKQSKDQARAFVRRIDELNEQVTKQNSVLVTVGEQLTAELSKVKREVLPALDSRLRHNSGQVEELAGLVHQADGFLRSQAGRLQDLEQQRITLAALRRKLTEVETSVQAVRRAGTAAVEGKVDTALDRLADLERSGGEILELQRTLTRTLEDVEDVVAELLQYTESELDDAVASALTGRPRPDADGAAVTATGRLWTRDDQLDDILTEMYERCVRASRLDVRFRTVEGLTGWRPARPTGAATSSAGSAPRTSRGRSPRCSSPPAPTCPATAARASRAAASGAASRRACRPASAPSARRRTRRR
ncbi:hypothetical protein ACFQHO_33775 [Actinomadura yumaensis]|uniref:hypothetical protein n=1 Tax=Actinomadura yumaensis TaxID=111807 RepID=UPI0036165582